METRHLPVLFPTHPHPLYRQRRHDCGGGTSQASKTAVCRPAHQRRRPLEAHLKQTPAPVSGNGFKGKHGQILIHIDCTGCTGYTGFFLETAGRVQAGNRELPTGARRLSEKSPAESSPTAPSGGDTPREGPQSGRRGKDGGRDARAPRWASGWPLKNPTGLLRWLRTRFSSGSWGHEGPLFHSRMIRPAGRGRDLSEVPACFNRFEPPCRTVRSRAGGGPQSPRFVTGSCFTLLRFVR